MSEIERYLDELFDQLAGQGAAGRRALAEAEDHLRAAAADAMARGLPAGQAELDAVARFGPLAVVARAMRSALGGGRVSRAVSAGWLLAGLAAAGLGVAYLAASGRVGWQSPARLCTNLLTPACYAIREPAVRGPQSAVIAAAAGAVLLLGWWLAVRYGGLAPVRRGFALAAGLVMGLTAFGFGMSGQAPAAAHVRRRRRCGADGMPRHCGERRRLAPALAPALMPARLLSQVLDGGENGLVMAVAVCAIPEA